MKLLQGFFLPFFLLFALSLLSGCGKKPLPSVWRDRPVTIDGTDSEWEDARIILDQASVGMGLMNDGEYLYLTLSLSDPTLQARIMRQGFIIWFDPRGGKSEVFGVRFPLGMQDMARQWQEGGEPPQGMGRGGMDRGRMGRGGTPTTEQLQTMYERLAEMPQMEILGPAKDQVRRLLIAESDKVLLATSYASRRLVYELRVPLAVDYGSTFGIGSAPGKKIGLGVEIPEFDMAALRQGMGGRGGGMPGGGMRGGGMDGGGMDGGMRVGGMRGGGMRGGMMSEAFRLWTKIGLASGAGQP